MFHKVVFFLCLYFFLFPPPPPTFFQVFFFFYIFFFGGGGEDLGGLPPNVKQTEQLCNYRRPRVAEKQPKGELFTIKIFFLIDKKFTS